MKRLIQTTVTAAIFSFSIHTASADSVVMPAGSQGSHHATSTPNRGMIESQVLERYGQPSASSNSVGHPPITIWQYPNFSVYFEFNKVIHTVVHAKKTS